MRRFLLRQPCLFTIAIVFLFVSAPMAPGQLSLTTLFMSDNGQNGNMFDITATTGVLIQSFDINLNPGVHDMEVYAVTSLTSFVGKETNPLAWTLIGSATGVISNGDGIPTPLPININVSLPPGQTAGFYLTTTGATSLNYTNGVSFLAPAASDASISIQEGTGNMYPFSSVFGGPTAGSASRIWNGTVHYSPLSNLSDDLAVVSIDSPTSLMQGCNSLGASEIVSMTIRNLGTNTISAGTSISVGYTVDDGINPQVVVAETFVTPAMIPQFGAESVVFSTTQDLSTPGTYSLGASVAYAPDLDPTNDLLAGQTLISGGVVLVTSFPWSENFDALSPNGTQTPPTGWEQDSGDGSGAVADWFFRNTDIAPTTTGPTADHTTGVVGQGIYAHVEDNGDLLGINLITPCLDLSQVTNPALKFWIHSNNANTPSTSNENFLHIDVLQFPGSVVTLDVLLAPLGHLGSGWVIEVVDISAFQGTTCQIRFRGSSNGGTSLHDIAIDDVEVFAATPTNGQSPQFGLAELDINTSSNGGGFPVANGFNGPYFNSVSPGDPVDFRFTGEPGMPIVLFIGNLNPGNAIFPFGQVDVGGAPHPVTGFPTELTVIADGSQSTGLNPFFNTGPTGTADIGLLLPNFPLGVLTTFQVAILRSQMPFVALSNAVRITVN